MVKSKLFCAAIVAVLAGPAAAQRPELISIPQATDKPLISKVENPNVALLRSAADWISSVFDLAPLHALPEIRRFPSGQYAFVSKSGIASDRVLDTTVVNYRQSGREIAAYYDDSTRTIYLPESWDGSTPAQMSILVHATAHHFQRVYRKYYDCPQERKALPYEAQERWLGLYDRRLREDFAIAPDVLMLITQCVP